MIHVVLKLTHQEWNKNEVWHRVHCFASLMEQSYNQSDSFPQNEENNQDDHLE